MAAEASHRLGLIDTDALARIAALLRRAQLPTTVAGLSGQDILDGMRLDKKTDKSGMRFILLKRIGAAFVTSAPGDDLIKAAIESRISAA